MPIHEAASVLSAFDQDSSWTLESLGCFYERVRRDDFFGALFASGNDGGRVETGNIPHQGNELQISNAVLQIMPNAFHDTVAPPRHCLPFRLRIFWSRTGL